MNEKISKKNIAKKMKKDLLFLWAKVSFRLSFRLKRKREEKARERKRKEKSNGK